MELMSIAMTR